MCLCEIVERVRLHTMHLLRHQKYKQNKIKSEVWFLSFFSRVRHPLGEGGLHIAIDTACVSETFGVGKTKLIKRTSKTTRERYSYPCGVVGAA